MPISFSAVCSISFVMRCGVGDGDGDGKGVGVGVGVCAAAGSERLDAATPAAPSAGRSLTNARRSRPPPTPFGAGESLSRLPASRRLLFIVCSCRVVYKLARGGRRIFEELRGV